MTHQRPKTDGVACADVCRPQENGTALGPMVGITDLTERVDATKTPAVIKATLFSEALCRLEQMKGEREQLDRNIKAQEDRVRECHRDSMKAEQDEMKRVVGSKIGDMTVLDWEKLTPEERKNILAETNHD